MSALMMALGLVLAVWQLTVHFTLQPRPAQFLRCVETEIASPTASDLPAIRKRMLEATLEFQHDGATRVVRILEAWPRNFQCDMPPQTVFVSPLGSSRVQVSRSFDPNRLLPGAMLFLFGWMFYKYATRPSQVRS